MTEMYPTERELANLTTHRAPTSVWEKQGWDGKREPLAMSRILVGVSGAALVLQGLRQRTWAGRVLATVGGGLAWWALTGEGDLGNARRWFKGALDNLSMRPDDAIHQASDESFPASDAPSWTPTVGIGVRRGANR